MHTNAPLADRLEFLAGEFARKAWEHPESPLAEFLQAHALSLNEFARQARETEVPDGKDVTGAQAIAVARMLARNPLPFDIRVAFKSFDLPDGYITFQQRHRDGLSIYGGISAEGEVST